MIDLYKFVKNTTIIIIAIVVVIIINLLILVNLFLFFWFGIGEGVLEPYWWCIQGKDVGKQQTKQSRKKL